jgi:hypothetical protein
MKRLLFLTMFFSLAMTASAQKSKPTKSKKSAYYNAQNKKENTFLNKQWWLGFKAGANLAKVIPTRRYSVMSAATGDVDTDLYHKTYEDFNKTGTQASLEITFFIKGICISLQPMLKHSRFIYTNRYEWADTEDADNRIQLNYEQEQKVDHFVLPLLARYEIGSNKLRPYVQAGTFTSFLINATKSVKINGVDYTSGVQSHFTNESIIVGATDIFAKRHWGLLGGGGLNYSLGNVRLNFDAVYFLGMSDISSTTNRFGNDRLAGVGDALDDLRMNNIILSLGALFPLRFLEDSFKSQRNKK